MTSQTTEQRRRRLEIIAWAVVFSAVPIMLVSLAIESTLHFRGIPIDGPFQLYNPLRRIAAGQRGGVDFQFFHGIGIPYLAYLPFRLGGGSFAASELTRQLLGTLAATAVIPVFIRAFTRDWRRVLALSTATLAGLVALGFSSMALAAGSLLTIRTALPTLTPLLLMLPLRRELRGAFVGAAIGCSFLLGTEQALALLAAFLIMSAIRIWRSPDRAELAREVLVAVPAAALCVVVALGAIGGFAGIKGVLVYNLKLVPMDQYWYFGVPPNGFAASWSDLARAVVDEPIIPGAIVVGALILAVQLRRAWREPAEPRHAALALAMLYALIACASLLGILSPSYVGPCVRMSLMIGALELDGWLGRRRASTTVAHRRIPDLAILAAVPVVLMAVWVPARLLARGHSGARVKSYFLALPHLVSSHLIPRRGMVLDSLWPATLATGQQVVDAHRGPGGAPPTLWSTYAGWIEARNGIFQPSVDYIIHALGPEQRARYVEDFRAYRPTLVQTMRPTYIEYETWIEQTSWDFYDEVLRNYRIVALTPWSIFWERLPSPAQASAPFLDSPVAAGTRSVDIVFPGAPSFSDTTLVQVELHYRAHNPLRKMPIIGAQPRYLVNIAGAVPTNPVTLDPYVTTARFPLAGEAGGTATLTFTAGALTPGATLEVTSIRAFRIAITPAIEPWFRDLLVASSPLHHFR